MVVLARSPAFAVWSAVFIGADIKSPVTLYLPLWYIFTAQYNGNTPGIQWKYSWDTIDMQLGYKADTAGIIWIYVQLEYKGDTVGI